MRNVPISVLRRVIPLAWLLAGALVSAEEPVAPPAPPPSGFEKGLREAMALPADTKLVYRDEDGKELSPDQFSKRVQEENTQFDVQRDEKSGTATLKIRPKAGSEGEIGPVTQLPPLDLKDLYGRRIRNLDFAGRPTLLSFFFETCVPCIKEAPVLTAYRRRHQEFNYLAVTPDNAESAKRFVQQHNLDWPVAYDGKPFIDAMQVKGFPTYVLVASDGRILGRGSGMNEKDMADPSRALGEFEKWVSSRLSRRD